MSAEEAVRAANGRGRRAELSPPLPSEPGDPWGPLGTPRDLWGHPTHTGDLTVSPAPGRPGTRAALGSNPGELGFSRSMTAPPTPQLIPFSPFLTPEGAAVAPGNMLGFA